MTQKLIEPRTPEEMISLLFETGKMKLLAETLAAARQKRMTRADFVVIQRRVLAMLDETRASAGEFSFDVDEAVDRTRDLLAEFARLCMPAEWR